MICIVAFRTDTDRAVRYRKVPIKVIPAKVDQWNKVRDILQAVYEVDGADFVSIRFIRQPKGGQHG